MCLQQTDQHLIQIKTAYQKEKYFNSFFKTYYEVSYHNNIHILNKFYMYVAYTQL